MIKTEPQRLIDNIVFPESPRWRQDKLWFADIMAGRVMTVDLEGHSTTVAEHNGWVSGLGWLANGQLEFVSMQDNRLMRLDDKGIEEVADLKPYCGMHCNDMVVDKQGRAYIGNVGYDIWGGEAFKPATLVMVSAEGDITVVEDNLTTPNGVVITEDGDTLIIAESTAGRLTAFTIQPDGTLTGKRIWAEKEGMTPDGICLDAEGGIWVASPLTGEIIRIVEGGEVTDTLALERMPVACMLGGSDGCTLFICTMPKGMVPEQAATERAGAIEMLQVSVGRSGLP